MAKENGTISNGEHRINGENSFSVDEICPKKLPPELWTPTKNHEDLDPSQIKLPPEEWTAHKVTPREQAENHHVSPKRQASEKKKLSYEEIIQLLEEKIKNLLQREDFTTTAARPDLKFVQRQTRYNPDVVLNRRIVDKIVKLGIAHVFLRVWRSVTSGDNAASTSCGAASAADRNGTSTEDGATSSGALTDRLLAPENSDSFRNLQTTLSIVWNCSDKSSTLCECLVRCGVLQLLLEQLGSKRLSCSLLKDDNELYLVKAYLGLLHNIVRLSSDSRRLFRATGAVATLQSYLGSLQGLVKTKAYLILSYIINETENDVINATDENIAFIIGILREALLSENHFAKKYAFWASEILCGLNHLAVNDSNKLRICQHDALPLYFQLLKGDDTQEQSLAVAGLWILAFNDQNKQLIHDNPEFMQVLKSLVTDSPHESIRRSARGALWVIRSVPPARPLTTTSVTSIPDESRDVPHVMISYHWANQSTLLRVRNRLMVAGFKVWMDIDNMSGSTLEAMALAVERAAVVLVALSQGYKDSPSCRTEAEYTYRQRKDIVPLLLQPGYVPDGWLGILVGARLFFDLSSEEHLDANINKLIRELGSRGRWQEPSAAPATATSATSPSSSSLSNSSSSASLMASPHRTLEVPGRSRLSSECSDSLSSSFSSTSSLHTYMRIPVAKAWTQLHVRQWLQSHQLSHISERLEAFNGELLLQYKKMMDTAPDYFYHSLERHLKLDLVTTLQFAKALESIT